MTDIRLRTALGHVHQVTSFVLQEPVDKTCINIGREKNAADGLIGGSVHPQDTEFADRRSVEGYAERPLGENLGR